MLPLDSVVRVFQLTCPDYDDRDYSRLGQILLCDYRGQIRIADTTHSLVAFTFPRWFNPDGCCVTDGLTYLWVSNNDLEIVSLQFCGKS
jgi:hypothetical protein